MNFQRQRFAAGNALGLPKWVQPPSSHPAGLSDGEPTATDIVLQQSKAAWRREKVDKKAVYPNELQFRARGTLWALGKAPPGNATRSSCPHCTGAPDYEPHPALLGTFAL